MDTIPQRIPAPAGFCRPIVPACSLPELSTFQIAYFFDRKDPVISILVDVPIATMAFNLLLLLPNMLFLGLCIWLRQKIIKEVRFARPRTAFLWGFLAGIFPLTLLRFLELGDTVQIVLFLIGLAWHDHPQHRGLLPLLPLQSP